MKYCLSTPARPATRRALVLLAALLAVFVLAACARRPEEPQLSPEWLPPSYSLTSPAGDPARPWWLDLDSGELSGLMAAALAKNPGLREAQARLDQAEAAAHKAGAEGALQLSASAGLEQSRFSTRADGANHADQLSLGLAAGYEIDLWGRLRADAASAQLGAQARAEDLHAAMMTLSGRIGENWISLIELRRKLARLDEQLDSNRQLLDLIETRASLGKASALDVYQQRQTVAAIEAGQITIRGQERLLRHELALLAGRPATDPPTVAQRDFPSFRRTSALGLPADLLVMRPDVRAAALRLEAAGWDLSAARADLLPRLQLTGSLGYGTPALGALFDNWLLNLAAGLGGPLLDGGRRRAEVDRVRAVRDEDLAAYAGVVLVAVKEVEDALAGEDRARRSLHKADELVGLAAQSLREATFRYLNGRSDLLPVLREQLALITAQLDQESASADLCRARIGLHRALGGSWPAGLTRRAIGSTLWLSDLELVE